MKGLLQKEFYNLSGYLKIYLIMPILFAAISVMNRDLSMVAFGTSYIVIFVVMTSCAFDETCDFNTYALTLPISRKDIVLSKFIMANIFSIMTFIIANLLAFLLVVIFGEESFTAYDPMSYMLEIFIVCIVCNICNSILLAIIFKFGTEKGRIVFVAFFMILGASGFLLAKFGSFLPVGFLDFFLKNMIWIVITGSILFELASIQICNRIMLKKEI